MCNKLMRTMLNTFHRISDRFKTQGMCIKAVEVDPSVLQLVPDHHKMQEIYDKAVKDDSSSLKFVLDWFVSREWVVMWYGEYYDKGDYWVTDDEEKLFERYDGCKKRKA